MKWTLNIPTEIGKYWFFGVVNHEENPTYPKELELIEAWYDRSRKLTFTSITTHEFMNISDSKGMWSEKIQIDDNLIDIYNNLIQNAKQHDI